ncbi:MAG: hypothetical protein ISR96_02640 [Nitrospira sp.]|nr:hypothetical protein [Nitrospira sp.]
MGSKNKTAEPPEKTGKQGIALWVVAGIVVVVVVLAISGNLPFIGSKAEGGKSFNLTGKETRPVIDAAQFTGQTRQSYAAAKKYPDAFNEVFCYCYCDQPPFHHKTLLSCFVNNHGAG